MFGEQRRLAQTLFRESACLRRRTLAKTVISVGALYTRVSCHALKNSSSHIDHVLPFPAPKPKVSFPLKL